MIHPDVEVLPSLRGPWLTAQKAVWPFVKNLDVLIAGLNFPDIPSAEAFQPNIRETWERTRNFTGLLQGTPELNLASEEAALQRDLTVIYNK